MARRHHRQLYSYASDGDDDNDKPPFSNEALSFREPKSVIADSDTSDEDEDEDHDSNSENSDDLSHDEISNEEDSGSSSDESNTEDDSEDEKQKEPTHRSAWDKRRNEIIGMLLNKNHEIHLLTGNTKKEQCEKIWRKYASNFDQSLVMGSVSRSLLQLRKGELSSKKSGGTKDGKPFWKDRKKSSAAYGLLYKIRMNSSSRTLTTEEIYKRHKIFDQFDFRDFTAYGKSMVKLTDQHREYRDEDTRKFNLQRAVTPRKEKSSRGKKFWSSSEAERLLIDDVKSGKAFRMKPSELYETQEAYREFSLLDFRKHVYQEKYKQIAGPYWQRKRNRVALKEHMKSVNRLYQEFRLNVYEEDLDAITEGFKKCGK